MRELAEELLKTFESLRIAAEARKAVRFYAEACRQGLVTPAVIEQVVTFLRRLERQPQLLFDPG